MSRHLVIARMSAAPRFIVVRTGQESGSERVQPSDTGEVIVGRTPKHYGCGVPQHSPGGHHCDRSVTHIRVGHRPRHRHHEPSGAELPTAAGAQGWSAHPLTATPQRECKPSVCHQHRLKPNPKAGSKGAPAHGVRARCALHGGMIRDNAIIVAEGPRWACGTAPESYRAALPQPPPHRHPHTGQWGGTTGWGTQAPPQQHRSRKHTAHSETPRGILLWNYRNY